MSEDLKNSRIRREFQKFYLFGSELSGLQSCQLEFLEPITPIRHIGLGPKIQVYPNGIKRGNVNISYVPMISDPFINYVTGNNGINFYLLKSELETGNNYSVTSGFVTSYSSKCSINNIPNIDIGIDVLGDIGILNSDTPQIINDFNLITGQSGLGTYKLATYASIDLTLDDFETNRILSYDLNINSPRNPVYSIGSQHPINVELVYPLEVIFNCNIDLNDYKGQTLQDYPCKSRVNHLVLSLKDHRTYEEFQRYSFDNLILIGNNYITNVNGNVSLNLQYKTYIGRPTGATLPAVGECTTSTTTENPNDGSNFLCPTGKCIYNSGTIFECKPVNFEQTDVNFAVGGRLVYNIAYNGIDYGALFFKYQQTFGYTSNSIEHLIWQPVLDEIIWNFSPYEINPPVGTLLMPEFNIINCISLQNSLPEPNCCFGYDCGLVPFNIDMGDCIFNFCISLPTYFTCGGTTTTTTSSTTTSTTTTATPTTSTTSTSSTTPTTTTTTTTSTTSTTTTSTTSTTTSTSTTTTTTPTTTTTSTTTPIPCDNVCDGLNYSVPINFGIDDCSYVFSMECNCQDLCNAIKSLDLVFTVFMFVPSDLFNECNGQQIIDNITASCGQTYSVENTGCSAGTFCAGTNFFVDTVKITRLT